MRTQQKNMKKTTITIREKGDGIDGQVAQLIVDKDVTEEIAIHVMTTVAKMYAQRELSKAQCKVEKDSMKNAEVKKTNAEAKSKEKKDNPKKEKNNRYGPRS